MNKTSAISHKGAKHHTDEYPIGFLEAKLYSAVIADILDDLGYPHQTLDSGIRLLDPQLKLVGRAFTVLAMEVFEVPKEPYKLQMEAVDSMRPGEIFVVHTGAPQHAAFWGELLSTACRARGGRGALVDGLNRDSTKILEMQFPLLTRGQRPTDSKGRVDVVQYQVPVEVGGVIIHPGDLIFGDIDGCVIIPQAIEKEAIERALAKVEGENVVRKALQDGMPCVEAFKTFGIL
jgi:4-hydroxy-4-methyl-2-oxoglutarate aldolase